VEDFDQAFQVASILLVECLAVDLLHFQRFARNLNRHNTIGAGGRKIADPSQPGICQPWSASTSMRQFNGRFLCDRRFELRCIDRDNSRQILNVIKFQVLVHMEPVAEGA
jgi:hypothetical protein